MIAIVLTLVLALFCGQAITGYRSLGITLWPLTVAFVVTGQFWTVEASRIEGVGVFVVLGPVTITWDYSHRPAWWLVGATLMAVRWQIAVYPLRWINSGRHRDRCVARWSVGPVSFLQFLREAA